MVLFNSPSMKNPWNKVYSKNRVKGCVNTPQCTHNWATVARSGKSWSSLSHPLSGWSRSFLSRPAAVGRLAQKQTQWNTRLAFISELTRTFNLPSKYSLYFTVQWVGKTQLERLPYLSRNTDYRVPRNYSVPRKKQKQNRKKHPVTHGRGYFLETHIIWTS